MANSLFRKKSIAQIQADAAAGFSDAELVPGQPGEDRPHLRRSLGTFDLTMMGIAAIVGAGIFALVGEASFRGGPGVIFLFVFASIACGFAALCYAEFASKIPIAGSAYTYAYASFGELIAWIIGWDLLVEYAIGNIAVAISWSDYFTRLLLANGINIPAYVTTDYLSASRGFEASHATIEPVIAHGQSLAALGKMNVDQLKGVSDGLTPEAIEAFAAWTGAPQIGGMRIILDLPALGIVILITALVYVGIRESKTASNIMVGIKLAIIALVIIVGAFFVKTANWVPFLPNGFGGVMSGAAAVFFAYIGFDALSTTAEECKDPYKTLPRGMIYSLAICTVLYILIALVLTGMVKYTAFQGVGDPLAFVFGPQGVNIPWISGIIAVGAIFAIATVLLVFQLGQPRLWMAMSRDGLLPKIFSSIHPRFRTPWFSTLLTGVMVAVPALFMNLSEVTNLSVIGTLFAFVIVCAGVLVKDKEFAGQKRFVPYINSRYIAPVLFEIFLGLVWVYNGEGLFNLFALNSAEKIPYIVFFFFSIVMTILCVAKRLSLIPVLGVMCCTYLMTELGWMNWVRFGAWMIVGLRIYRLYSFRNSKVNLSGERIAGVNLKSIVPVLLDTAIFGLLVIPLIFGYEIFYVSATFIAGGLLLGILFEFITQRLERSSPTLAAT